MSQARNLANFGVHTTTSAGAVTFLDGATDVDVAQHDGSNGLKLGGTLVTQTAAQINTHASTGKAIAEELRGLAVEWNIPVVSATQLNRAGFMSTDVGLEDTSESFGLPATADFMFALITTEELEEHNQIKVKQLKNRYNDPIKNRTFVVGIDRAKMRLYDVEEEAQKELITEPKERGIRTKSTMSWDRFKEEKKKSGLEKIVV